MELNLRQQSLSYLQPAVITAQNQEETSECIVPDSSPDIERVLETSGMVLLRGKECREGSCTVSGSVRAWVVYLAEKESTPRRLELTIPFSARMEHPSLTPQSEICFSACLRSLDTRVVNPRKVSVRAGMSVQTSGWSAAELPYCSGADGEEALQCRVESRRLTIPVAAGEKPFVVSDELELPDGQPPVRELLRWNAALELTEARLVGEKAVFKGSANVEVLYTTEQGTVEQWQTSLPFSQYMELEGTAEDDMLHITPALTGAELEPDGAGTRLQLTLNAVAQCLADAQREISLLTDLYSLTETAKPQLRTERAESLLDRQRIRQDCRETLQCPSSRPVAARVLLDAPVQRQEQDRLTVAVEAQLTLLYLDGDGQLQTVARRASVECQTELAAGCVCRPAAQLTGAVGCVPAADGVELRFAVDFLLLSYAQQDVSSVAACELAPLPEGARQPSLIVRTAREGESLWSIAKACRSSVAAISEANGLDAGDPRPGALLLIPRG